MQANRASVQNLPMNIKAYLYEAFPLNCVWRCSLHSGFLEPNLAPLLLGQVCGIWSLTSNISPLVIYQDKGLWYFLNGWSEHATVCLRWSTAWISKPGLECTKALVKYHYWSFAAHRASWYKQHWSNKCSISYLVTVEKIYLFRNPFRLPAPVLTASHTRGSHTRLYARRDWWAFSEREHLSAVVNLVGCTVCTA